MAGLRINIEEKLRCVDTMGRVIELEHAIVKRIPYLNVLLLGEFSQLPRNPDGALILPESVNVNFLKPIISFVEKEDSVYLFSKLGEGNKLPGLIALMDFLCVPVPKI